MGHQSTLTFGLRGTTTSLATGRFSGCRSLGLWFRRSSSGCRCLFGLCCPRRLLPRSLGATASLLRRLLRRRHRSRSLLLLSLGLFWWTRRDGFWDALLGDTFLRWTGYGRLLLVRVSLWRTSTLLRFTGRHSVCVVCVSVAGRKRGKFYKSRRRQEDGRFWKSVSGGK